MKPPSRSKLLDALADLGEATADRLMRKAAVRPAHWEDQDVARECREVLKNEALAVDREAARCRAAAEEIRRQEAYHGQ